MINAFGNLSGFTGSMITAVAENLTGDINNGTYVLAGCLFVSGARAYVTGDEFVGGAEVDGHGGIPQASSLALSRRS